MTALKVQFGLIGISLFNLALNVIPGSRLRRIFLNAAGNHVGSGAGIHSRVRLTWPRGLSIGEDSTVNFDCFLDTRGNIKIGNHVMVGHNCRLYTMSHDLDSGDFAPWRSPVHLEDYVVLFPNCLIMPGVKMAAGSVALPGSVVTKNVDEWCIVGGNPAKFLRKRSSHQSYLLDYQYLFINS